MNILIAVVKILIDRKPLSKVETKLISVFYEIYNFLALTKPSHLAFNSPLDVIRYVEGIYRDIKII